MRGANVVYGALGGTMASSVMTVARLAARRAGLIDLMVPQAVEQWLEERHAVPVRDVALRSGKTLALVTLDNGRDHTRPNTLGPQTLYEPKTTLEGLAERASRKEIDAVGITGKPFILAAGADLSRVGDIRDRETGLLMAKLGHEALGMLGELGVPSFAFINGLALGGGVVGLGGSQGHPGVVGERGGRSHGPFSFPSRGPIGAAPAASAGPTLDPPEAGGATRRTGGARAR